MWVICISLVAWKDFYYKYLSFVQILYIMKGGDYMKKVIWNSEIIEKHFENLSEICQVSLSGGCIGDIGFDDAPSIAGGGYSSYGSAPMYYHSSGGIC